MNEYTSPAIRFLRKQVVTQILNMLLFHHTTRFTVVW